LVENPQKKLDKIDILNDACFKSLFRSVEARGMFARFLSAVTGISKEDLLNAEYIGGELPKERLTERGKIADIIVKVKNSQQIIIEMNKYKSPYIFEKNTSYAYSVINEYTKRGIKKYPTTILINIDNFNAFNTDAPILYFKLRDQYGNEEHQLYNSIHIILENFKNPKYNIGKEITKYLEFITAQEFSDIENISEGDEDYMAAFRKVEDLSTDPEFIGYYDYEEAHKDDIEMAEYFGYENGVKQGIEQGTKLGIEQGTKLGLEQRNKEMVISMKEKGLSLEMIADISNLSIEEVETILNS